MASVEAILSRLSMKSASPDPDSLGGIPEFTREDVMGALPRLDHEAGDRECLTSAMVMYYYVRDAEFEFSAAQALLTKVLNGLVPADEPTKPHLIHMVFMALQETIGRMDRIRCRSCRGRFEFKSPNGEQATCKFCHEGLQPRLKLTDSGRAKHMDRLIKASTNHAEGMTRHRWVAHFSQTYEALCSECDLCLADGLRLIKKVMGS